MVSANGFRDEKHRGWSSTVDSLPLHSRSWRSQNSEWLGSGVGAVVGQAKRTAQRLWKSTTTTMRPPRPTLTSSSSRVGVPQNVVFVLLCGMWYTSSALSSNTGKAILMQFRYPITLTFVQFGFVAAYCLLFMSPLMRFTKLRPPSKAILKSTLPMGMFQVGGHMFSSMAISRIPVSTVHTIKALSPLFTVAAYALLFGVSYNAKTYLSLLPLTVGVMLACSGEMSASNIIGLLCAFGSAIVFVSSNIFFKKIMPSNGSGAVSSHKLDKLNLLFYSSGMAFLLMIPIWAYYDLPVFLSPSDHVAHPSHGHSTPHSVLYYFFMNGSVHFGQNIIAFIILGSTSPVTYSIASLIKRVVVICMAIVWFAQPVHAMQAFGIALTFTGLYMYNSAKSDVEKGEKKMRRVEAARDLMLPSTESEAHLMSGIETPPSKAAVVSTNSVGDSTGMEASLSPIHGRPRAPSLAGHPPLTIKVTPPQRTTGRDGKPTLSPVDSYPSPPPSLDSPPASLTVPNYAEIGGRQRLDDIQERLGLALEPLQISAAA